LFDVKDFFLVEKKFLRRKKNCFVLAKKFFIFERLNAFSFGTVKEGQ